MEKDLWRLGVTDLVRAIREKTVSSHDVVQSHLNRIEAVNAKVNAVTVVLAEEALQAADEADNALAKRVSVGPLHGIPMTIKENIDLTGSATSQGVIAMKDALPLQDAPHVSHLKRAGAIPIGRTNLPDLGLRWHTDNALRGATRNPWNRLRTPGGSSGGEAVAIATGMSPLGIGNDYGGSLRYPAQCCGIVSIRPTLGRVPHASSLDPFEMPITMQLFAVQGPMARHVQDLRLALNVMMAPHPRDPWWTPAPLQGPALRKPIRIGVAMDPCGQGVDQGVGAGVRKAAQVLSEAGYKIEEVEPPSIERASQLWAELAFTEIRAVFLPLLKATASKAAIDSLLLTETLVPKGDLVSYMNGLAERNRIAREWAQFADQHPLILGPVSTMPPFEVGYDLAGVAEAGELRRSMRLVTTVNLLGLPSVAVPVGVTDGLPQGVQIIGPRYREDLCLEAAEAIEERVGVVTPIDPKN